jgi:general stress protein 26
MPKSILTNLRFFSISYVANENSVRTLKYYNPSWRTAMFVNIGKTSYLYGLKLRRAGRIDLKLVCQCPQLFRAITGKLKGRNANQLLQNEWTNRQKTHYERT